MTGVQTCALPISGQATLLPEGRTELDTVADALLALDKQIPPEIAWVLRVDGHTDVRPINSAQFKSNWDLSAARAVTVVRSLVGNGIPANRIAEATFGENQPLDPADTPAAYAKNRRIEIRLTEQ